jgi:hypothetical protein
MQSKHKTIIIVSIIAAITIIAITLIISIMIKKDDGTEFKKAIDKDIEKFNEDRKAEKNYYKGLWVADHNILEIKISKDNEYTIIEYKAGTTSIKIKDLSNGIIDLDGIKYKSNEKGTIYTTFQTEDNEEVKINKETFVVPDSNASYDKIFFSEPNKVITFCFLKNAKKGNFKDGVIIYGENEITKGDNGIKINNSEYKKGNWYEE